MHNRVLWIHYNHPHLHPGQAWSGLKVAEVQRKHLGTVLLRVSVDPDYRVSAVKQSVFVRHDDALEIAFMLLNVLRHADDVGIVKRCVHLIEDEKR